MDYSRPKVLDFSSGKLLICSDLHGNLKDYLRIKKIFLLGKERSDINFLLFLGDIIHGYGSPSEDKSKEIVDDLMAMMEKYPDSVFSLLGNHELCHIYDFPLIKGRQIFNPCFEEQIKEGREKYISFFKSWPAAVRTKGGVLITHAGANSYMDKFRDIFSLDHDQTLAENQILFEKLSEAVKSVLKSRVEKQYGGSYDELSAKLLGPGAVSSPQRRNSLLRGTFFTQSNPKGQWLWDMFCNKNEHSYGKNLYSKLVSKFLSSMSDEFGTMRLLLTGHIDAPEGFELFEENQFRLCTSKGAKSDDYKYYLLLDASALFSSALQLKRHLYRLY